MRIEINEPQAIWEIGQQTEQQDNIYPRKGEADQADRIFIVSHGHASNGLTSQNLIKNISGYFKRYRSGSGVISDDEIMASLETCRPADGQQLSGISFAMLCIHVDGVTVVSAGNCRVFQIRPSAKRIVFENNGSDKATVNNPAITHIDDIEPGDYFVVCSDGIMESMDSAAICQFFSEEGSDDRKRNMLRSATSSNKGNHTAYFIKIRTIVNDDGKELTGRHNIVIPDIKSVKPISQSSYDDDDEDDEEEVVVKPEEQEEKPTPKPALKPQEPRRPQPQRPTNNTKHQPRPISQYEDERHSTNVRMVVLVAVIVVLAIAAGTLWYFNTSSEKSQPADTTTVEAPAAVDTTAATGEPADSAMIPDTAIAEPERNMPIVNTHKRTETHQSSIDDETESTESEATGTESTEPTDEHSTEHKAESGSTTAPSTETPKAEPSSSSTTAQ